MSYDEYAESHLLSWVFDTYPKNEQFSAFCKFRSFVLEHPDMLDSHSWPEIRGIIERNEKEGIQ
jgi:hypothetical protein